jgi:hypothetical protein
VQCMGTLRALGAFFSAVIRRWAAFVTGGVVVAIMAAYEHAVAGSVSWLRYAVFLLFGFVCACFLAFKDQFEAANRAQSDLSNAVKTASTMSFAIGELHNLRQTHAATKAELENLKAVVGEAFPFSAVQRRAIIRFLSEVPVDQRFEVRVDYPGIGSGAGPARAVARAFQESGWRASTQATMVNPNLQGINIAMSPGAVEGKIPPPREAMLIMNALSEAGVLFSKAMSSADDGTDYFQFIVSEF